MDINGYELGSIAFMSAGGPLWETTAAHGAAALACLRSRDEGDGLVARWRAWSTVDSARVARLIDVVRHDDGWWAVVCERVPGETLESAMARGSLRTRRERERVVEDVREGVRALHRAGIVHGDLSPANIILRPDGRAVVVDLIDDPLTHAGTRGWSQGGGAGEEGDWRSVALLAEELGAGGRREAGISAASTPSEALRRVAAAPRTERQDAPARHRGGRHRLPRTAEMAALGAALAGAAALATLTVPLITAAVTAGAGTGETEAPCPAAAEVRAALDGLARARDDALERRDADAVAAVSAAMVARSDRGLVEALVASGTRVENLGTRVGQVADVTCEGDRVSAVATIQQLAHRRCDALRTCAEVPAQRAHRVRVDLATGPWRILSVQVADGR
jgi:hypothetical protein